MFEKFDKTELGFSDLWLKRFAAALNCPKGLCEDIKAKIKYFATLHEKND